MTVRRGYAKHLLLVFVSSMLATTGGAQAIYTTATLTGYENLTGTGSAAYRNSSGNLEGHHMSGWLGIGPCLFSSGGKLWSTGTSNPPATWSGTVTCPSTYGECHRSRIEAESFVPAIKQASGSAQVCVSGGGGCTCTNPEEKDDEGWCPLVVNTEGESWSFAGADDPVTFDLDADGQLERIGWTARGSTLAFPAVDLNGNGTIDNGSELFGIGTLLPGGVRADNGFEALRQHDGNGDGVINASDAVWAKLHLWTDVNHDGASQRTELILISATEVSALELDFKKAERRDAHGNLLRYRAHARIGGTRKPFYDVFFVLAQ